MTERTLASLFDRADQDALVQHKPTTRREYMAEAVRLRATGLYANDVAAILGLTRRGVLDLWHEADTGTERFPSQGKARPCG